MTDHSSPVNAEALALADKLARLPMYHQDHQGGGARVEITDDMRVDLCSMLRALAQQTTDPVAWLDIRTADLGWQNRIIATNPQYVQNNGPENFVALYASSSPECRPLNDEELADLHMDAMETSRTMKDLLTSPGCGEVDPTRPACGQGDEHGRKPTEKGYGHD